uniref:Cation-transporting P-type ATPase C-terminal domain-containing protein n=1 Tax=Solanum lycopersicum TaxID=4081 RepID=A0A3Q7H7K0_SOLLC
MVCAVVSISVGFATEGWPKGTYDGLGVLLSIFLVVVVAAISDYRQSLQFRDLDKEKKNILIQVTRDGFVAVPEGLPLAVTLSLAFAMKKLIDNKALAIFHNTVAEVVKDKGEKKSILGTPTESAILEYGLLLGGDIGKQRRGCKLLKVIARASPMDKLVLATEPPHEELINRPPVGREVFNEINSSDMEKINVFRGIFGSWIFVGVITSTVVFQVIIVEFLGTLASTTPLSWKLWLLSVLIGAASLIVAVILKLKPVEHKNKHHDGYNLLPNGPELV